MKFAESNKYTNTPEYSCAAAAWYTFFKKKKHIEASYIKAANMDRRLRLNDTYLGLGVGWLRLNNTTMPFQMFTLF